MASRFGQRHTRGVFAIILFGLAFGGPKAVWGQVNPSLIRDSLVQVAVIDGDDVERLGSGFIVANEYVLTAAHLVANEELVVVVPLATRVQLVANIVQLDEDADLALLSVSGLTLPPVRFARDGFEPGRQVYSAGVWSVGRPVFLPEASADFPPQLTEGAVGGIQGSRPVSYDVSLLEHNAMIPAPGYGGPLLNECGEVAGLNRGAPNMWSGQLRRGQAPVGVVYAVGATEVVGFVRAFGVVATVSSSPCANAIAQSRSRFQVTAIVVGGGLAAFAAILVFLVYRKRSRGPGPAGGGASHAAREAPPSGNGRRSCLIRGKTGDGHAVSLKMPGEMLVGEGAVIGRSPRNATFVIDDRTLSRSHARLYAKADTVYIEDLGTTNGTKVNGRALDPRRPRAVHDGDEVELGAVQVRLAMNS